MIAEFEPRIPQLLETLNLQLLLHEAVVVLLVFQLVLLVLVGVQVALVAIGVLLVVLWFEQVIRMQAVNFLRLSAHDLLFVASDVRLRNC